MSHTIQPDGPVAQPFAGNNFLHHQWSRSPWPGGKPPPVETTPLPDPVQARADEALPAIEGTLEQQRAALESVMWSSRTLWNESPAMQAKHRQVIDAQRTGKPLPIARHDPIAAEIARIEQVLFTDRQRYQRDEGMQTRYRELLSAKHGA